MIYSSSEDWKLRCEARYYLSHMTDNEIKNLLKSIVRERSEKSFKLLKEILRQEWGFVVRSSEFR
jgi:hypothetical protein